MHSIFPDINLATPAFLWLVFTWYIFSWAFTLNSSVSVFKVHLLYTVYWWVLPFCLLIISTFQLECLVHSHNTIINKVLFRCIVFLFVFYFFYFFISLFPLFCCLLDHLKKCLNSILIIFLFIPLCMIGFFLVVPL